MIPVDDPASFWAGVEWTLIAIGVIRFLVELRRASKGWRR